MSSPITVRVDKDAFYESVKKLLSGSDAFERLQGLAKLKLTAPYDANTFFDVMHQVENAIGIVVSAVEVAKQNAINQSGGGKFDRATALETAVKLLDDLIVFEGIVGFILEKVDQPILSLLISIYVNKMPKDWTGEALKILGKTL